MTQGQRRPAATAERYLAGISTGEYPHMAAHVRQHLDGDTVEQLRARARPHPRRPPTTRRGSLNRSGGDQAACRRPGQVAGRGRRQPNGRGVHRSGARRVGPGPVGDRSVASVSPPGRRGCVSARPTRLPDGSSSGDGGTVDLELVALVVDDYDEAIAFFVDRVGFELVEDSPSTTNDGRPKRWVVVRPPQATTGILLARATATSSARSSGGSTREGRVLLAGGRLRGRPSSHDGGRRRTSSASRATSRTVGWPCSSTWPATDGTCSARSPDVAARRTSDIRSTRSPTSCRSSDPDEAHGTGIG